eukprot:TRINITY_DN907_c0_g1_i1.p1 TRINITY_DN907_c0_g1~~TRINITY_DN907_c0_g1_i1.p1  ORF type:complete len:130 (+),score=24.95 TRINITY_DN907_c0_g1_i1:3375-3764(+)
MATTQDVNSSLPFSQHPFDKRKSLANKMKSSYPDRVPIIVERYHKSTLPQITKTKFLAPGDLTITQFRMEIRQHITLSPSQAVYFFSGNTSLPLGSSTMKEVYERYKSEDDFLYISYAEAETFGAANNL